MTVVSFYIMMVDGSRLTDAPDKKLCMVHLRRVIRFLKCL